MDLIENILRQTWLVTGQMAPYLLFGFLLTGLIWVFLSPAFVQRHLGQRGLRQVIKAALFGVPMPLCSCGVLPVSASLRAQGASRGATLAFLISTPQSGLDCITATQALLGPVFVAFTVATTFLSGLIGGAVLEWATPRGADAPPSAPSAATPVKPRRTLRDGFRYGFVSLPREIGRALLLGIVLSGVLMATIPPHFLEGKLGGGLPAMLVMLLIGIPMYVCSMGSIPVAYAFINMGISPGAALVFLVSGPATNAAAMTTIARILGRKALVIYLLTIAGCALAAGLCMDALGTTVSAPGMLAHHHEAGPTGFNVAAAVVLLAMLAPSLWKRKPREA